MNKPSTPFAECIGFGALSAPDAPKVGFQALQREVYDPTRPWTANAAQAQADLHDAARASTYDALSAAVAQTTPRTED